MQKVRSYCLPSLIGPKEPLASEIDVVAGASEIFLAAPVGFRRVRSTTVDNLLDKVIQFLLSRIAFSDSPTKRHKHVP